MFDGINLQSCQYYLILSLYLISLDGQNLFLIVMVISIFIICILNSKEKYSWEIVEFFMFICVSLFYSKKLQY